MSPKSAVSSNSENGSLVPTAKNISITLPVQYLYLYTVCSYMYMI